MLLFKCTSSTETIKISTEIVRSSDGDYGASVLKISSLEIKSSFVLGGLISASFGSITILKDSFSEFTEEFDVTVYSYDFGTTLLSKLMECSAVIDIEDQHTIVYKLWPKNSGTLLSSDKWVDYGMVGSSGIVNELSALIGITSVVMHEESSWVCSGFGQNAAGSRIRVNLKAGTKVFDAISDILRARCCIGVIDGNTLNIYNSITGYGNVVTISHDKCVSIKKQNNGVKDLTIKSEWKCWNSPYDFGYGIVDTTTVHNISHNGLSVSVNGMCEYSTDKPGYVSTYTYALNRKNITVIVTIDIKVNIGDLVIVIDAHGDSIFMFFCNGLRFDSDTDMYTVYGVEADYSVDPIIDTYMPNSCPFWSNQGGGDQPSSITSPAAISTITGTRKITVSFSAVDGPVEYASLYDSDTGESYYSCGTSTRVDGSTMSITFEHDFPSGTHHLWVSIFGTTIKNILRTVTFA